MKILNSFLLVSIVLLFSSCGVATGIFKAGMLTTIIIIVLVVAVIIWLFSRGNKS